MKYYRSLEEKTDREERISEMEYESSLDWKFMKKLRSETEVRHWHIKVHLGRSNNGRPLFEDFNVIQTRVSRLGEQLYGYRATRSGKAILSDKIFDRPGENWLHGIEYLLRSLEGQDISQMRLDRE